MKIKSKNNINAQFIQLDEKLCKDLLAMLPEKQRAIRQDKYTQYLRAIETGKWMEGVGTIEIDRNGELGNGQHRLKAFLRQKYYPEVLLLTNVPPEHYKVTDTGAPRTYGDQFKAHGVKDCNLSSAITKVFLSLKNRSVLYGSYSAQELLDFYDQQSDVIHHWRLKSKSLDKNLRLQNAIMAGTSCYAEMFFPREQIEMFWHNVSNCLGGDKSPTVALRKALLSNATKIEDRKRDKYKRHEIQHIILSALRKQANREKKVSMLKVHGSFPYLQR